MLAGSQTAHRISRVLLRGRTTRMFRVNTENASDHSPPKGTAERGELKQGATRIISHVGKLLYMESLGGRGFLGFEKKDD